MASPLQVGSEVGRLRRVLLHRPGRELENLLPDCLTRQLFDDIPYLARAQAEHDILARTLREHGCEVLYLEDLVCEAAEAGDGLEELIDAYATAASLPAAIPAIAAYLRALPLREAVLTMMSGIRKSQLGPLPRRHLADYTEAEHPFYADPLPNLYFTRDPGAVVGSGVLLFSMANPVRQRETLFSRFVFRHHPDLREADRWYDESDRYFMEGGDLLVLSPQVLAVGLSQRTEARAAELAARRLLEADFGVEQVLIVEIPHTRAFMHLDTVMTMVDRDKFVLHPHIRTGLRLFSIGLKQGRLQYREETRPLEQVLARALGLEQVTLLECGGGSGIDAAREQWNDGANTLALAPGEVIAYTRNYVTNRLLRENGVTVHEIPAGELSRGRGGPHCMTMPLWREALDKT